MRPQLTLFGPAAPDAAAADPVGAAARAEAIAGPRAAPATAETDVLTARISATARGPGNAVASHIAMARIGPSLPRGYPLLPGKSNSQ